MENINEMKVLLWSVTCGVAFILGLMVAITWLLLRQNKLLKNRRNATPIPLRTRGHERSRRGHNKKEEEGYLTPIVPPPVSASIAGRFDPPKAAPRNYRPSEDSPSSSLDRHIYEDADFPNTDYVYDQDSESY
ncbi:uncharacterized protein LOC122259399 [Penaeus japonicus]|uniref:uncharacterized protein LOC122259399 n=1 Tax=Penaeus japonicus TaxID=27405 RepID=UPI001C710096|nr:uncharacterized protein LOC122259399 [Penaeus japonicus]